MRYSQWEQRQMDIKSGDELDRHARRVRLAQPCKNEGNVECRHEAAREKFLNQQQAP